MSCAASWAARERALVFPGSHGYPRREARPAGTRPSEPNDERAGRGGPAWLEVEDCLSSSETDASSGVPPVEAALEAVEAAVEAWLPGIGEARLIPLVRLRCT